MRLYPSDLTIETPGEWHWCPEGAKALPFSHRFASSVWDLDADWYQGGIGEIPGSIRYSKGESNPRLLGQSFCGPLWVWQNGSPITLRGTPVTDIEGVPICCGAPPLPEGGLKVGMACNTSSIVPILGEGGVEVGNPISMPIEGKGGIEVGGPYGT